MILNKNIVLKYGHTFNKLYKITSAALFALIALFLTNFQILAQESFTPSDLVGTAVINPTSLQFGPDDRLYVSQQDGLIYAYTIQRSGPNNYQVTDTEIIDLVKNQIPNFDDDGTFNDLQERQVTGLCLAGTASNPILYVSSSDKRIGAGGGGSDSNLDTNSGVVSRLLWNGASWEKVDLVRGLPRSEENHSVNGLIIDPFDPAVLYLAYGGNTNAGAPSANFAYLSEFAYSTAILRIDLDQINSMPVQSTSQYGYDLDWIYDLPTLDDPTRSNVNGIDDPGQPGYDGIDPGDPFGGNDGLNQAKIDPASPVQIHSPGWRNVYDLVITTTPGREGRMYAVDNGANQDWGGHPDGEADYPAEASSALVTNNYIHGEPGSSGPGPGEDPAVNNLNGLHYVRPLNPGDLNYVATDPFENQLYYAGHPNPVRANPSGAGLFTKGTHTLDPGDGGDDYWRNQILPTSDPNFALQSLPVDWPPVPANLANPAEGDFRNAGDTDGAIAVFSESTNGICEYTASNFGGNMAGDLIMAGFNGNLFRAIMSADGQVVDNCPDTPETCTSTIASGFGSLPLDVIALGDDDLFPGTIWAVTFGSGDITIFEPADYDGVPPSPCDANIFNYQLDSDGDGYTDGDENDNGTDPCSAASQPIGDFDETLIGGFLVSDINDPDDDDDGLTDLEDPFVWDASNGMDLTPPFFNDLFNEQGVGLGGVGITGLMSNGVTDYHDQFDSDEVILGGTSGLLTVPTVTSGDAFVNNLQDNAFQFGMNVSTSTGPFTVKTRINGPFFNNATPVNWQSQGFYIGTGDQSNYLKLVLTANDGAGGFQVFQEEDGAIADPPNDQITFSIGGLLGASSIELYLWVDPADGTVQPKYSIDGGVEIDLGTTFALEGSLLDAVQGNFTVGGQPSALAVGVIATSFNNQPEFTGTWDYFEVTVDNPPLTTIQVDPITDQIDIEGAQPNLAVAATGGSANLNYSATGLPDGLSIEPTNGQIIGTIQVGASTGGPANDGVHQVNITVDDGGISPDAVVSFSWTVNPNLDNWSQLTNVNEHIPRHENSFTQLGDKFFLLGGRESDQVEIYDYATDTWSAGATAPSTIHHFQAVAYQGYIWAITGFKDNDFPNEQPADNIFLYDPVEDQWLTGPPIPASRKRGSAGVVEYNGKFYIVGGLQNGHTDGWVPWFDEYDPSTNTWTELPDAPRARDHFHAAVVGDKLYVVGGRRTGEIDTFSPTIPEVDVYDFTSSTWLTSNLPDDIPVPRAGASTVNYNGQLVVIGGEANDNAYALTDALDVATGQWSSLASLNTGRHGTQAIVSGDGIHITSGSPVQGGGTLTEMEVYGTNNPTGIPVAVSSIAGPAAVDFGVSASTSTISITNTVGNQGIFIASAAITGNDASDFTITNGNQFNNLLLNPGDDLEMELSFNPSGTGSKSATLEINYGGDDQLLVDLTGSSDGSCNWTIEASPEGSKFEAQTVVVNDKLYVFAGFTFDIDILSTTEVYDPVVNSWRQLTPMPEPVTHVGHVVVGDEVWFAGGFTGDSPGAATDVVQVYNTLTDTWTNGPSLPAPRGSMAMALVGNNIHVFGGLMPDRDTDIGEHYVLDLGNQALGWVALADMPDPRNHHAGVALNGLVYAIGGQFGHDSSGATDISSAHVYDPATDIWNPISNLPELRSHIEPSTFIYNNQIMVVGGRSNEVYLSSVLVYDPPTDQWSEFCDLPVGLIGPGAKVIGNKLVVTNGGILPLDPQNTTYSTILNSDPQPPLVSVGENISIDAPTSQITISATATDTDGGSIVDYEWSQQSGPNTASFAGAQSNSLTASGLIEGAYIFRLTVTDDEGATGYDELQVTVNANNQQGVISFTLIDAFTNQPVPGFDPIVDGSQINLTNIGTDQLNIRANTNPESVGSVVLNLVESNGGVNNNRTENVAPFALFGDAAGDYQSWSPAPPQAGFSYTLTGSAYSDRNGGGNLLGALTISFSFIEQAELFPPVADAGADQSTTASSITLNGSGSDPDGGAIEGYQWSQQSGPNTATLAGEDSPDLTMSNLVPGSYVMELQVTDDEGDTDTDQVTVTVSLDLPPVADAGADQSTTASSITLNGSGSDPDGGAITDYQWSQQSGPNTATLAGEGFPDLTMSNLISGSYVMELQVTDDEGDTDTDLVTITVSLDLPPVADAGADQSTTASSITLNGSGSDPDGGAIADYQWSQQSGPNTATLAGEDSPDLTMSNLVPGSYVMELQVTDDEGDTDSDLVTVTVSLDLPPVADAGADQSTSSSSITLNGSGSDPDGGTIAGYLWSQQSGPNTATLTGENTQDLTMSNLVSGSYVMELQVTDDEGDTDTDLVTVTVDIPVSGVVNFTLMDAETDQPIALYDPIVDGTAIDLSALPSDQLSIRANTNPATVGSVSFTLQGFNGGADNQRTENGAPYALFGDVATDYAPWSPAPPQDGYSYNLTATAFNSRNGGGGAIGSLTISFSFTNSGQVNNPPVVSNPGTQNSFEGDNVSLGITANDGDDQTQSLTYEATNLPSGLSIDPNSGIISGLITAGSGNGGVQEENGLVIVEMESAAPPVEWTQGTDGGVTYLEANQDNFNNPAGGGVIDYEINISTPGIYRVEWRSKINQGNSHTDSNDNWLKFPNNNQVVFFGYKGTVTSENQLNANLQSETNIVFPIGSGLEGPQTTPNGAGDDGFFKVFMNTLNSWVWSAKTSDSDGHQIFVNFISSGTYTMQVSNRSAGHAIDRIALYKIDTYGNDYSDALLTSAPASETSQSGASANSPYSVEVTVTDDGNPALSATTSFTWNVQPEPAGTANFEFVSDIITPQLFNSNIVIKIYPNPASSFLNIDLNSVEEDHLTFSLFSVTGRSFLLGEFKAPVGVSTVTFDTRDLHISSGSYYLKIRSSKMKTVVYHKLLIR